MRYKKISIIACAVLFAWVILLSASDICRAESQAAENSDLVEAETKAFCLLGEKVDSFPFYVYKDADSAENKFFPTGNMGDLSGSEINAYCDESPYSGSRCVKITYKAKPGKAYGWAGLYWQYPANNWGNMPKAYDLTKATKLTFWARGQEGREVINKFQVGGIAGKYRDSGVVSIGPITLSREWKQYTISLKNMDNSIIIHKEDRECWPFMDPLSRVIGGFCWATSPKANDNQGVIFYLDEIRFEND